MILLIFPDESPSFVPTSSKRLVRIAVLIDRHAIEQDRQKEDRHVETKKNGDPPRLGEDRRSKFNVTG